MRYGLSNEARAGGGLRAAKKKKTYCVSTLLLGRAKIHADEDGGCCMVSLVSRTENEIHGEKSLGAEARTAASREEVIRMSLLSELGTWCETSVRRSATSRSLVARLKESDEGQMGPRLALPQILRELIEINDRLDALVEKTRLKDVSYLSREHTECKTMECALQRQVKAGWNASHARQDRSRVELMLQWEEGSRGRAQRRGG
ncbi:hypothetical protein DFH09DRAFT_1100870 [Mycena vulgaris]|nr:hypothetical protein DFH09DRAFT_1100870 [Mycena vulgaris]